MLRNEEEKYKQRRENPGNRKGNLDFFGGEGRGKNTICNTMYFFPAPLLPPKNSLIAG